VEKLIHIEDYYESGETLPSLSATLCSTLSDETPSVKQDIQ
jgi:hypothetical protein